MTQEPRTTESESRDNAAIRDIMHRIRELTVPDRATLCLGLVGHLATLMNSRQMEKLMGQLNEEAARVQDVPPSRQGGSGARSTDQQASASGGAASSAEPVPEYRASGVGQAGRGAVTEERTRLL